MPSLPIKTTSDDVKNLVNYLKTKATGATVSEAKATIGSALVDGRKLAAYELWGVITKEADKLKLTQRGRDLSRASEDGTKLIFRAMLRSIGPYKMALEWFFHQHFESITHTEVAAHWHDHLRSELGTVNENTIKEQVLTFFSLASAAGLGNYIVGRKGNSSRFEPNRDALGQFIGEAGLVEDSSDDGGEVLVEPEQPTQIGNNAAAEHPVENPTHLDKATAESVDPTRIFISHSKNMAIVDQVKTMLEMGNLDFEVAEDEQTTAIPVPDKVFGAMRRCTAAVICVTADDQWRNSDGDYAINQNVLIEIGAAFVLYDKKVILVWDKRLNVPSNLQGLYRCEFEGEELSWNTGINFMKGVNNFRK